jgi:hypothetical protein
MLKKGILMILIFCCSLLTAQQKDSLIIKNGIDKPNILTLHHFGIFSARINQNFKISPPKKTIIDINYSNGNTFHPFVETYYPKDPAVREDLSNYTWYYRRFNFIDQETTPADYTNIVVDAVIKQFRANISFPLGKHHELQLGLRSYLITKGKHPFSFFTSDEGIEWFHSNIAGGEDPYGRRYYGLNQVNFKYTDRNGRILELHNNDFFIGGIEVNHFYYPSALSNMKKNVFVNFGSHLGINTSKFNPSLDLGISVNAVKKIKLKNHNEFNIGIGTSLLHKNVVNFGDVVDLGNNPFMSTIETDIEFTKYTKNRNYHSLCIDFQWQSSYNKLKEADYYFLSGKWQEINGGWQHGTTTLHTHLSVWSLIYTYGRPNYKLSLYFKEDFLVNNAPDFQTGISLSIPVFNSLR